MPSEKLLVAVDHNQLWTMASETVDPIDWSHPTLMGSTPWAPRIAWCKCRLQIARLAAAIGAQTLHLPMGMPDQCTACVATQGMMNIAPIGVKCPHRSVGYNPNTPRPAPRIVLDMWLLKLRYWKCILSIIIFFTPFLFPNLSI